MQFLTMTRIVITGLIAFSVTALADITSVSVPSTSLQGDDSYPTRDNVFTVAVPPYPFNVSSGIGHIVNNNGVASDVEVRSFSLHAHSYTAPYIPTPDSIVTYTFDVPTVVDQVEFVQHANGVARIEGFVGTNLASMVSIGNVFGPQGNVQGAEIFAEGETQVFNFTNTIPGTIFQFRITQTSLENGYALYRAYPRDSNGNRILPAECAAASIRMSEVEVSWPSRSNRLYTVEFCSSLNSTWLPLATNILGNGEVMRVYDKLPIGAPHRFYRIQCP